MSDAPRVALSGIRTAFGPVVALEGVDLVARAGEVHGVVGENGAGKSTLMHALAGLVPPDAGTIAIDGQPVRIADAGAARRLGIGMVHQHFALVPTFDAVDNLALAVGRGFGALDRAALRARADAIAGELGWTLAHGVAVGALPVAQQQRVEIVKAIAAGGRVVILDEPTAVLAPQEVAPLLSAIARLAQRGAAVLFISHKLSEVEAACDRITVLRRGRVVHHGVRGAVPAAALAALMVGEGASVAIPARRATTPGETRLALAGVTVAAARGAPPALSAVDLAVRAGEIVGIAGVDGNGQDALVGVAIGALRADAGTARRAAGAVAVIPADRRREGLVVARPVEDNLLLRAYARAPYARRALGVRWRAPAAWRAGARALMDAFAIRASSSAAPVARLSGGNQQKVVIARELSESPALIVAVNPTRGLDLAAAAAVLTSLIAARDAGAAVLLVHHDLDELLAVADRVAVLYAGRLTDSGWPASDRGRIGALMAGA